MTFSSLLSPPLVLVAVIIPIPLFPPPLRRYVTFYYYAADIYDIITRLIDDERQFRAITPSMMSYEMIARPMAFSYVLTSAFFC